MTDEASLRHWLSENCLHVWSLLKNQARKQLPPGLLEYLSPLSEEQLDILAEEIPELHRGYLLEAPHRQRYAQQRAEEGRQQLRSADEHIKGLIQVCGLRAVCHAYRRPLSRVDTGDKLAEIFCEIALCTAVSALSSTPPCLQPPSGRPGRNTHCDVRFQVAGIPVYGEGKRYPDPWLRERLVPGGRDELQPIDLYGKLRDVPEQFPEGMVNLVFVFHRSFNDRETLEQVLFGWGEARLRPVSPKPGPQEKDGLFAREEWL